MLRCMNNIVTALSNSQWECTTVHSWAEVIEGVSKTRENSSMGQEDSQ